MVKEIARSYYRLLFLPVVVSVVAVLSTSKYLVLVILFSALLVFLALYTDSSPSVSAAVSIERATVFAGDEVELVARFRINGGLGLVTLAAPPASYAEEGVYREVLEVVDGKSAIVAFKGLRGAEREIRVRLRALRRGSYELGRVRYAYHHLFGLRVVEGEVDSRVVLTVLPRYRVLRRWAGVIRPLTVTPRVTSSRLGPYSTEFMDIRQYAPGDPFRFINWKATARSARGDLMVNEYEREGMRSVIFLLDLGPWMRLGHLHDNPLEHGISVILSLSRALLRHGYNVGLWTVPSSGVRVVPSSGQTQFYRLVKALLGAEHVTEARSTSVDPAFLRVVVETRPLIIAVANLANREAAETIAAQLRAAHVRPGSAVVVDVIHGSIVAREALRGYVDSPCLGPSGSRIKLRSALPRGVRVVSWDPACEGMGELVVSLMPGMRWLS